MRVSGEWRGVGGLDWVVKVWSGVRRESGARINFGTIERVLYMIIAKF